MENPVKFDVSTSELLVSEWTPDLRRDENRLDPAMLVKF